MNTVPTLRQVLARDSGTALPQLLEKAAGFHPQALQQALGDELLRLCRPVGFVDRAGQVVLMAVATSCAAHEVALRKPAILQRLRGLPAFARVRDLRVCVQP
ncbi:MAG: DciA family protein [Myxococcota bacterium]